ncbi:MAG TPA: hypothetical protein VNQ77_11045 [Frankiaceae bacterium]|nr:hypothetical protein [Frankiaceae bacterium]
MRKKLALAGLVAGIAAAVLPTAPASAQCSYTIEGVQDCGNCAELFYRVDAVTVGVREKLGVGSIGDMFVCTQ